jgi:hypothetical protein
MTAYHSVAHTNLVNRALKLLATLPRTDCVAWRNPVGVAELASGGRARFGLFRGSADIIACVRGRFVGLEAKTGTGRLSEDQARWHDEVRIAGGVAYVFRTAEEALGVVRSISERTAA